MKLHLLLASLLITICTSCSYNQAQFEKQSGKVNKVRSGEKFYVSLPEDHKTKYYWGVNHDYNKNTISYIASVFHGTTVEFNFEGLKPGKTEITFFMYSYQDTSQTKTYVIEVE